MTDAIKSAAGRPCGQESVTEQNLAQLSRVRPGTDPAELENVVQQVIESLVKLGAWQQIRGLRTWMGAPKQFEMFKSLNLDLLEAAALQADSKYSEFFSNSSSSYNWIHFS